MCIDLPFRALTAPGTSRGRIPGEAEVSENLKF